MEKDYSTPVISVREFPDAASGGVPIAESPVEQEMEMTSSSITVFDNVSAFSEMFGAEEPNRTVSKQTAAEQPPTSESIKFQPDVFFSKASPSPISMSQLVREQASKIRELEVVNIDLVNEIDRISRIKDQLIGALQIEVQKWRVEARDNTLRASAIQGKADQADIIQVEHDSLQREVEDLRYERDNLLVRLEKNGTETLNVRNELRNKKLELNNSNLEIGRLKLELETTQFTATSSQTVGEGFNNENALLNEQLAKEKQDNAEKASSLVKALDEVAAAERRETGMHSEIASLRRRLATSDVMERELLSARRKLDCLEAELRDAVAENSFLRSEGSRSNQRTRPEESCNEPYRSGRQTSLESNVTAFIASIPTIAVEPRKSAPSLPLPAPISSASNTLQSPGTQQIAHLSTIPGTTSPAAPSSPKVNRTKVLSTEEKNIPSTGSFLSDYSSRIVGPSIATSFVKPIQPAPFATESSSAALVEAFDAIEKVLTAFISEKNSLREEAARYVRM